MELYILRHGIAEPRELSARMDDSERALTREGKQKMRRIAEGMKALEYSFDIILTSPLRRAEQTASIVARVLQSQKRVKILRELAAGHSTKELVEALRQPVNSFERILLVGHEPDLSSLIVRLVTGGSDMVMTLKKGGLCKLTVTSLRQSRCAVLEWSAPPSQLVRIR
ncbi:MAG: phosphohistidine phosphatase SixA [Verrucomicrobia bacterium]|nr:phosphohistidine phosphatase SixA [Verrucomicrobiota bacterium]